MPTLDHRLELDRCPHCSVSRPTFTKPAQFETKNHRNTNRRVWCCYTCGNCGGVVLAAAGQFGLVATEIYPDNQTVDDSIPERAKSYLEQSINSIHAPSGAVMLAASAVDAMLKEKDYREGSLYTRIEQAATDHLITQEMAQWAHDVRLDANDQRHVDDNAGMPTEDDAQRAIDFTLALAQFLFVLPQKVQRGIDAIQ